MSVKLSVKEIQEYHKNKFPWFFIDFVNELIPGKSAEGIKLFSVNETFFNRKDNINYEVPSFAIGEALEQMFLMTFLSIKEYKNLITNTIQTEIKYIKPVQAGEKLKIISNLKSLNRGIATGSSIGYFAAGGGIYENEICASAEFKVVIPEIMNNFTPVRKEG